MSRQQYLSKADQETLATQLMNELGIRGVRAGCDFDPSGAVLWTGEGAGDIDGLPAFDYYAEDPQEVVYQMGIHKKLVQWAEERGLCWEPYDSGTYLAYRA